MDACPSRFYALDQICYGNLFPQFLACHNNCKECFRGGIEGCLSCDYPLVYWENQCLSECPEKTYSSISYPSEQILCLPCKSPCELCNGPYSCLSCAADFYWNEGNCLDVCFDGKYPDDDSRECLLCDAACSSCYGPSDSQCKECNLELKYEKNKEGRCTSKQCPSGTYLAIVNQTLACLPCSKECLTCDEDSCLECASGYITIRENDKLLCKTCEEVNSGYYTNIDGDCEGILLVTSLEICGDGIKLGQVDCDDGNKKDGDGCSSDCKIEEGYACTSHKDGLDTCTVVKYPRASLTLGEENILVIDFSELMYSLVNSTVLASTMKVSLINSQRPCNLLWELQTNFVKNVDLIRLEIRVDPKCSIEGTTQFYVVVFDNPSLLISTEGYFLSNNYLQVRAKKFRNLSKGETLALEAAGEIFSSVSLLTLLLMLGISLFQSAAIGSLWTFVNMLQLLSYLPGLNCYIPSNLEAFLTEYLTVKDITIPFNKIPDFPFNPMKYIECFITNPFSVKFETIGYESISFLFNCADELLTWLSLLLIYLFLKVVCRVVPEKK